MDEQAQIPEQFSWVTVLPWLKGPTAKQILLTCEQDDVNTAITICLSQLTRPKQSVIVLYKYSLGHETT